jgi:GTP-binding protein YchF
MSLKCGIVGLPNVGKSTIFNALTSSSSAVAANYPFCTIEPNVAFVEINDERLKEISKIANSEKIIPSTIQFVDIAGLVKGASKGEGLGNKFLSHIREVDLIIHVLRHFKDPDVTHVNDKVDHEFDKEIIETELILADLESVEKRIPALEKKTKSGDKENIILLSLLKKALEYLRDGRPARLAKFSKDENKHLNLLTTKPILHILNIDENDQDTEQEIDKSIESTKKNNHYIKISAKIESEISIIKDPIEKAEFLSAMGLKKSGLDKIIQAACETLKLDVFFTAGPKETRAWNFKRGTFAPQAAGIIHSDFERGFICAEITSYQDYINCKGSAKGSGLTRTEGKKYVMQDGDVTLFRFNV